MVEAGEVKGRKTCNGDGCGRRGGWESKEGDLLGDGEGRAARDHLEGLLEARALLLVEAVPRRVEVLDELEHAHPAAHTVGIRIIASLHCIALHGHWHSHHCNIALQCIALHWGACIGKGRGYKHLSAWSARSHMSGSASRACSLALPACEWYWMVRRARGWR